MQPIARILLILALLAFTAPARAAEPPLTLYAAPYPGDVLSGGTFEVVLSLYGTSPTPLDYTLDAPAPDGLQLLSTTANTSTIALDRPVTILLHYRVTAPNDGRYIALRYRVRAGADVARVETAVRVGSVVWPRAQFVRKSFLPYVRKTP